MVATRCDHADNLILLDRTAGMRNDLSIERERDKKISFISPLNFAFPGYLFLPTVDLSFID